MGTTGQSITLANSIIGVGILAMPFCFQQCGVLLASLILLVMGLISRLCCYFLLKSALLARRRNFEFLAFHVFGSAGKMAVEVGIIGFLMGTCIAYFVVVGDLGPQIIAKMFNINQSDILRTSIMVIVSLVCVLPLGLLRNVDSLSNVSAATIGFYFCLVLKVITEAASQLITSDWHRRVEMWRPAGLLQCVPIFSMALFCQTQLFEIFESLPTLSLEKMSVVTKNAINICTGVYFTLGVFGYIAFCSQDISGNILMSLSPTMASDVIKLGFVMSLAFSFPLIIFPCRASLYSFLYKKVHSSHHDHIINHSIPETTFRCITVAIIAVALFISLLIPNIELVLGLLGSTIGVLICVVFPAACFVNVTFKNTNERLLAKGVLVLGLIILVLGTYANLEAAGENSKIDRYDEKYTQENIDKIVEDFFEKQDKDDVYLKPQINDPIHIEKHKSNPINNEKIKDSEVQPPNPVPPESHSNEKIPEIKLETIKSEEKKVAPIEIVREEVDKASETHPKNVKTKLAASMNGFSKTADESPQEIKPQSSEDNVDISKQQKVIETIKQHGEEQKELMKEQNEILNKIIEAKQELQQKKDVAETNEAKKVAVESIKQIANIAIQSIGGVSEKPDQVDDKKDRLEKLTNDAVQEIAKKAAETIEAIQEINENSLQTNIGKDVGQINQNAQPQVNSQNIQPQVNLLNAQQPVIPQIQPQGNSQNQQQINSPNQPQVISQNQPQINSQNQPQINSQNQPQVNSQNQPQVNSQNQPQANSQYQPQVNLQNQPQVNSQNLPQANSQYQPQVNSQNQPQVNSQIDQANRQNIKTRSVDNLNQLPQNVASQNVQPQAVKPQNILQNNPQPINPQLNQNVIPPKANANVETLNVANKGNPTIKEIPPILPLLPNNQPLIPNLQENLQQNNIPDNIQTNNEPKPVQNVAQIKDTAQAQSLNNGKHSHSLDEPQSYKQGEDAQIKNPEVKMPPNVPLPMAINDLLSSKQIQEKEAVAEQLNKDIQVNVPQNVANNDNLQPSVARQKREVVDCTKKVTLEPKDKEICNTLIDMHKEADILPPVDLNDALVKNLVIDPNMHIGRSLKSFDKDER